MEFRQAREDDLPVIVAMLADDALGRRREAPGEELPAAYARAFAAIDADPAHRIIVAEEAGEIVAFVQLSFLPNLTYTGGTRAQLEGLRVAPDRRRRGIGEELVLHALELAKERGCRMVQLTTDKARPEAQRFYEGLGFFASHEGLKLHLELTHAEEGDAARPSGAPLDVAEIERVLAEELTDWSLEVAGEETAITRRFEFPSFAAAVRFMAALAPACEKLGHHPTQRNTWRRLTVTLTTHDADNRVTPLDLALARRYDAAFRRG